MRQLRSFTISAFLALTFLSAGCARYETVGFSKSSVLERPAICDPFSPGNTASTFGLKGEIRYLTSSQPRYDHVQEFQDFGQRVNADLFLSQLNVPTRAFSNGFTTQGGEAIRDDSGAMLIEWFSIHMKTSLTLSAHDAPGDYQFAAISDDGMVMTTDPTSGSPDVLINNDGLTPSRLGCGATPVHFDATTKLPVKISYFQGPRYHIALMLLWRPLPSNPADQADPSCGVAGNDEYFDSATLPSTPKQTYQDLLNRGWKPLGPENYLLTTGTNRCI